MNRIDGVAAVRRAANRNSPTSGRRASSIRMSGKDERYACETQRDAQQVEHWAVSRHVGDAGIGRNEAFENSAGHAHLEIIEVQRAGHNQTAGRLGCSGRQERGGCRRGAFESPAIPVPSRIAPPEPFRLRLVAG